MIKNNDENEKNKVKIKIKKYYVDILKLST